MSARDYKAEADYVNGYFTRREATSAEVIALGQMNATLALVEQTAALVEEQRTANLIANSNFELGAGYGIPKERLLEIQGRLA